MQVLQLSIFITRFKIRLSAVHCVFSWNMQQTQVRRWFQCLMVDGCGAAIQPGNGTARKTSAGTVSEGLYVSFTPRLSVTTCEDLCKITWSSLMWPHDQTMTVTIHFWIESGDVAWIVTDTVSLVYHLSLTRITRMELWLACRGMYWLKALGRVCCKYPFIKFSNVYISN